MIAPGKVGTYYCVKGIIRGETLYLGDRILQAAMHLVPGTCYGYGPHPIVAEARAEKSANHFRGVLLEQEVKRRRVK
jgi:hypothetical protein